jgi:hypothetical protein
MSARPRFGAGPRSVAARMMIVAMPGVLAVAAFASAHLSSTGFWYDESMQFWISLGSDGFSPPWTRPGDLKAMIHSNAVANLDPGGFTLLLRYWLRLGTAAWWQRLLPLLFAAAAMAGLGWIGWSNRRSVPFACLSAAVVSLFPLMMDYASEVRGYSMEVAGVVIGYALIERLARRPDLERSMAAGLVFGLFLGSRYSFAIFMAAAFLSLAHAWYRRERRLSGPDLWRLGGFALPVAIAAAVVFFLSLWPQYEARITYDGGALVQYLSGMTAAGKTGREIAAMLSRNLLSPLALPVSAAALLGTAALLAPAISRESALAGVVSLIERTDLSFLGITCLAALVLSACLWPWYPWFFPAKWSLWLHALSAVAVVRITAAGLSELGTRPHDGWEKPGVAAAMMALLLVFNTRLALYRRQDWPSLVPALSYLEAVRPAPGSVSVDEHSYPTVRYFYEYGRFAGSRLFPDTFHLPLRSGEPLLGAATRFLVTTAGPEAAARRFAPARILRDPALPVLLYRVEMP